MMNKNEPELYKPRVPDAVRTAAYVAGLVVATIAIAAPGITQAVAPTAVGVVNEVLESLLKATAFLASALGVVYRPTR